MRIFLWGSSRATGVPGEASSPSMLKDVVRIGRKPDGISLSERYSGEVGSLSCRCSVLHPCTPASASQRVDARSRLAACQRCMTGAASSVPCSEGQRL